MKKRYLVSSVILALTFIASAHANWRVSMIHRGDITKILHVTKTSQPMRKNEDYQIVRSMPLYLFEDSAPSRTRFEEIQYSDAAFERTFGKIAEDRKPEWPGSEVRTLVAQGPTANRINLTIVGDGYTADEKEKFFADAMRIKNDLFATSTYKSYTPLFNVFAVFVPSKESGLSDAQKRDTALGLYREPPGSKRGIMAGDPDAAERAIALAPAADFPILLANDDYYGGLGGRYAITTRSVRSGQIVLRHELGHNFGQVGEEYDGGYVYDGANSSATPDVSWKQWLPESGERVSESKFLTGAYVWQKLSDGPADIDFDFPEPEAAGAYILEMQISSVGWAAPGDVTIALDGSTVPYQGEFTNDRSFFEVVADRTLTPGHHRLEIRENNHDAEHVLAFAEIFAHDPTYDFSSNVGAYATFDDYGNKSYRPTRDTCIMRNMLSTEFCAIDKENMWRRFLARIRLIDDLSTLGRSVSLKVVPLAGLEIQWMQLDGQGKETELKQFHNQTDWPTANLHGKFRVHVKFNTPEVRASTSDFEAVRDFTL